MIWQRRTLGELCDAGGGAVKTGPFGSQLHESDYSDTGTPVVMPKDIREGRVSEQSAARVADDHVARLAHHRLSVGDIVYGRRGDIGRQALITAHEQGWLCGTGCLRVSLGHAEVDPLYLHYYLRDEAVIEGIANQAIGATMPNLNTSILRGIEIRFPLRSEQRRITSILSAYDDLIQNNTRRIAILEEMARCLYEEWFVRFRFPGHGSVRMVESGLGPTPEGWERLPLGLFVEHHIGGGWGQAESSDEFTVPAYVIRGTDIPDVRVSCIGRAPLRYHTASNFQSRKIQARDIVFEVSGGSKDQPVGRAVMVGERLLAQLSEPVICASFCRLVRVNASLLLPELLRFHFERIYKNREIMQYQTQSTGITNFKFAVFLEKELVLKPTPAVQEKFSSAVRPMLDLVEALGIKNANLRTTRDLLLAKLISGELDVSALSEPEAITA